MSDCTHRRVERWGRCSHTGDVEAELPEAEIAKFREVAAGPIRDKWIADMTAQGLPAQELYDLVMSTLEAERSK